MYVSNDWDELFDGGVGSTHKVTPLSTTVDCEVLEIHARPRDRWGEAEQGEDECYIIFRVGDRFFKKTGFESSYDEDRSWNGDVTEVFGSTKTITIFEPRK